MIPDHRLHNRRTAAVATVRAIRPAASDQDRGAPRLQESLPHPHPFVSLHVVVISPAQTLNCESCVTRL